MKSFRICLLLLCFLLGSNSLWACLMASQNRLFPLGVTSKGLCVVETHLRRTEIVVKTNSNEDPKPAWTGVSYFKIYDRNYRVIYSEVLDRLSLFEQHQYTTVLTNTFQKGLKLAGKYPDFVAANPTFITFCDYPDHTNKAEIVYDTTANKVAVQLPTGKRYDIRFIFNPSSIASNLVKYLRDLDEEEISAQSMEGTLYINSIRKFGIGGKTLTIIHIENGQIMKFENDERFPPGKEYKPNFAFSNLSNSVFVEPVLHHGHGFDFFLWE